MPCVRLEVAKTPGPNANQQSSGLGPNVHEGDAQKPE
jgi:hypothetical protein